MGLKGYRHGCGKVQGVVVQIMVATFLPFSAGSNFTGSLGQSNFTQI